MRATGPRSSPRSALVIVAARALRLNYPGSATTAKVTTGAIVRRIFATGTLRPRGPSRSAPIIGIVEVLDADFNSIVHANQVVAELDLSLPGSITQASSAASGERQSESGAIGLEVPARRKRTRGPNTIGVGALLAADSSGGLRRGSSRARWSVADVRSADAEVADAAAQVQQLTRTSNRRRST